MESQRLRIYATSPPDTSESEMEFPFGKGIVRVVTILVSMSEEVTTNEAQVCILITKNWQKKRQKQISLYGAEQNGVHINNQNMTGKIKADFVTQHKTKIWETIRFTSKNGRWCHD